MSHLEMTKNDIDSWRSDTARQQRYDQIMRLAREADLEDEYRSIPSNHIKNKDYRDFEILILALSSRRELFKIAEFPREMEDRKGVRD